MGKSYILSHILVIGGASLDTLHIGNETVETAGGAGLYTALAARRCGAQLTLFAPRPQPLPDLLAAPAQRFTWLGPAVSPDELPRFEIAYENGRTRYLAAAFGAETRLTPDDLPDLAAYDVVHVVPLGSAGRQLTFLQACRQRGARRIAVSASIIEQIAQEKETLRQILAQADLVFLNETEAAGIFGSPEQARGRAGQTLFITLGANGARVVQGEWHTAVPAAPAAELDPTGAGDTFCGAVLARLAQGAHPVMAARAAAPLAAQMIERIGPAALLWPDPPPPLPADGRVRPNPAQIERIAQLIATLDDVTPFPFTGPDFPPPDHPLALDFFFVSTLQQFGFWTAVDNQYSHPLIAPINGAPRKGSSYLFQAYLRALRNDPDSLTPARQASLTRAEMLSLYRAGDGSDPMPALDLHWQRAWQYGRDLQALHLTPQTIMQQVREGERPLQTFLQILDNVGGYKEDPLRKKSSLLAVILNQRPEQFLPFGPGEQVAPIIDYHLMRSCLRAGLIDVLDDTLRQKLAARQVIPPADEWAVRYAAYRAIEQVAALSGKSMGAVDWFFFNARRRCPEMTEPRCEQCPLDPACAHRKELFQPVLRTTFY